jgi:hypothetical protein
MVTRFLPFILGFLIVTAASCQKDEMQPANCDKLQQAILAGNPNEVEIEINRISESLAATPDSQAGLDELNKAISAQCKVGAVTFCYNCIETLPAQSEIKISVSGGGTQKNKIIDIIRSGDKFVFAGMHD